MISEMDSVVLETDIPDQRLCRGDVGTVVLTHGDDGYEVEFATLDGKTLAVLTLDRATVRPIPSGEIAHVRPVPGPQTKLAP